MRVAIVDYGLGNLKSVAGAVRKVGHEPVVTAKAEELAEADRLILPGVGAFGDAMRNLTEKGLVEVLTALVMDDQKPLLGICLGFQLLARESSEFGIHAGLGWINARVERINPGQENLQVPHVGWNDLHQRCESVLWDGVPQDALFYFVHSYHVRCVDDRIVVGECLYGANFVAAIQQGNIHATQFHPEKSQYSGLTVLKNFIEKT